MSQDEFETCKSIHKDLIVVKHDTVHDQVYCAKEH